MCTLYSARPWRMQFRDRRIDNGTRDAKDRIELRVQITQYSIG